MSHQSVLFRSPAEAEAAHPTLDRSAALPIAERDTLVILDEYQFSHDDQVTCQLERNGSICGELHGKGHIVMRSDGNKGYLGGCCSKKHFGESEHFRSQRAMVRRAIDAADRRTRLQAHVSDLDLADRVANLQSTMRALVVRARLLRDALPRTLVTLLADRHKRRALEVAIEVAYEVPDEAGNSRDDWRRERVGNLVSAAFTDGVSIDQLRVRVHGVVKSLARAREVTNPNSREVKVWLKELESVAGMESEVAALKLTIAGFLSNENLATVKYLAYEARCLPEMLTEISEILGNPRLTQSRAQQEAQAWVASVRRANGDRRFRAAQEATLRPSTATV
ncbi:MAG: hypothetical protein ACRETY_11670 [Steroidobacteraceae bacterium]